MRKRVNIIKIKTKAKICKKIFCKMWKKIPVNTWILS